MTAATRAAASATTITRTAAKSWSSTLRLPKSSFPARPSTEDTATYLSRCTDDLYSWQRQRQRSGTDEGDSNTFTLHDGPPYANGSLHVGHALNKILKDIVCRVQVAKGKRVRYVPGWDCHGLPIEIKALEKFGWESRNKATIVKGDDRNDGGGYHPVKVRAAAKEFAQAAVREQMQEFRSWGVMGDWAAHWKTMDQGFELRQLAVFRELARSGLIYRQERPVYWSPSSGSALAEAELEYRDDHVSTAALVKFPLSHHPFEGCDAEAGGIGAVVWTTTPWTIPANQAIAIRGEMEYVVVRSNSHGHLLLARSCLDFVRQMTNEELRDVRTTITGSDLLKALPKYQSLFNAAQSDRPMIHADFVKSDTGTGLVHCAPGHGMDDYQALLPLIRKQQVELLAPVDASGCFTDDDSPENPGLLVGQSVLREGNETVVNYLDQQQRLLTAYDYTHTSPYDWRTKQPVIVRATPQWFADVSSVREDALASLERVNFVPAGGKARLAKFVENRSEWCISRQRAWGVPIPSLYRVEGGEAVLTPASIDHIMNTIAQRGIDSWWSDDDCDPAWIAPELLQDSTADDFRRGTDTMDVWFDSGTSWSQLLAGDSSEDQPLADVYLEGSDQHRGWFQSSLLTRVAYQKSKGEKGKMAVPTAPFGSLITHGFALDERGRKMSKSEGNVIEPIQIIQGLAPMGTASNRRNSKARSAPASLGPDALRMWVASSDFASDVTVSDTVINSVHAALHKYRVTFKLLLGALEGFNPLEPVKYENLGQMDQLALHQLWYMNQTAMAAYHDHEFHQVVREVNRWVNSDLSGFYIEAIKDSLYCDGVESPARRAIQTTLYHVWRELHAMLAPLAPLLIEESWQHAPECVKKGDVHPLRREWTLPPAEWCNPKIETLLPILLATNKAVKAAQERARADKRMGSSLKSFVTLLAPDCPSGQEALAAWQGSAMQQMLVVSDLRSAFGNVGSSAHLPGQLDALRQRTQLWLYTEPIDLGDGVSGCAVVHQPESAKCERCWQYRADGSTYAEDLKMLPDKERQARRVRGDDEGQEAARRLCVRCTIVVENLQAEHLIRVE